jgi:CHASE1-domain containing sensor protein
MKIDALVYAVVVALTLAMPSLAYFYTADTWAKLSSESTLAANRTEQLAKDTEIGKIKPDLAGFPAYLRMQAAGERAIARMFTNHSEAAFSFMLATFGVGAVQAALLAWLFSRRRRSARETQP